MASKKRSGKQNNNLSVGQTASINNKDVRFGLSSKTNGNRFGELSIGASGAEC